MSRIMYADYAGIKNEQHIPDAVAQSDLKNGYVVIRGTDKNGKHTASVPSDTDECKGELWFVWNTIDKPEYLNLKQITRYMYPVIWFPVLLLWENT